MTNVGEHVYLSGSLVRVTSVTDYPFGAFTAVAVDIETGEEVTFTQNDDTRKPLHVH